MYAFGVDVGGTTIKIGFFETEGKLLDKWEIKTRKEQNGKFILDDIAKAVKGKLEKANINKKEVKGIGLGIPGPVNKEGIVFKCVNLGWDVFNVSKALSEKTGFPVKAGNDANVAGLGEMWKGGGEGFNSIVMVTLGTGVGGAVIVDGEIVNGFHGAGGEIGHININRKEKDKCGCGRRGCLEQYASATGIVKQTKRYLLSNNKPTSLRNIKLESLTAKNVLDAAKAGDEVGLYQLEELGKNLGRALATISDVCDPQAFVIGGGVSKAGDILIPVIKKYYDETVFHACVGTEFKLAKLGNDAGMYGAVKLVL